MNRFLLIFVICIAGCASCLPEENNATWFADLNDDCKVLLLEELDLADLLSMAELNPHITILAANVYKRKFFNKTIEIRGPFSENAFKFIETDDTIVVGNFELTAKLLHHFGSYVSVLGVNFWENSKGQIKQIVAMVNVKCAALKEFRVKSRDEDVLSEVKKPFYSVEDVDLDGLFTKSNSGLELNEMFPKIRKLSLGFTYLKNKMATVRFPKLLHLEIPHLVKPELNDDIKQMIKLYTRIESLTLRFSSMNILKLVSDSLPNLKQLQLNAISLDLPDNVDEHICLNSVMSLSVTSNIEPFARLVDLEFVEEFTLDCTSYIPDIWIDFIVRHAHLKKLTVIDGEIDNAQLAKLVGKMPNIVQVSVKMAHDVTVDTIFKFLESSPTLLQIEIISSDEVDGEGTMRTLKHLLKDKWSISSTPFGFMLAFIKIN